MKAILPAILLLLGLVAAPSNAGVIATHPPANQRTFVSQAPRATACTVPDVTKLSASQQQTLRALRCDINTGLCNARPESLCQACPGLGGGHNLTCDNVIPARPPSK
ncbi:uncharacterized protein PSFLO_01053 [Pseudozyma flocculosa]|uniref:Uncharacterized protein n=1 Tax=Pseudozyma flocculosa TaxID=84751 RepID=A0A5C3EU68_9BASI|nr:uncharacterized protein PSFLO_01053 [Pseudozyma flocculosa]